MKPSLFRDRRGRSLGSDRSGVTAMEYGLIAALIAVVLIWNFWLVGIQISSDLSQVAAWVGHSVGL